MNFTTRAVAVLTLVAFLLASCGGGGTSTAAVNPPTTSTAPASVYTPPAQEALTTADVQKILAQAIAEATARGKPAVIAITDRVGNVLALYQMAGAPTTLSIKSTNRVVIPTDIEGLVVPGSAAANPLAAAAIAKAVTGAYLSSAGNAFSTRTASFIVQEHYPPNSNTNLPSGPLFGVQFSQLPCSDFSERFMAAGGAAALLGPKRSPLGLAADPGGFPLYKNGVVVGGIGVEADGIYSYDANPDDFDVSDEEYIATAGLTGFEPPSGITADNITVVVQLRYTDVDLTQLKSTPANAPAFSTLGSSVGSLISLPGYYAQGTTPTILAGTAYGTEASGMRPVTATERSSGAVIDNPDAFVFSDGSGNPRYPIRAATDGADNPSPLTAAEVKAVLEQAFIIMSRTRAAIRQPLNSRAEVTMTVVDTHGTILGMDRAPDAPMFGSDVSIQKARTATFFSGPHAAPDLLGNPSADVQGFVQKVRTFLQDPTALTGTYAFADRSGGDLSRPYFPDGEQGQPNGPLSRPFSQWSPFSTGLQSALVLTNLAQHLGFILGASATDTRQRCTFTPDVTGVAQNRLQNGTQIFPGSVPIYRGNQLVGGIGVSGDGIDQDDMISFLGLYNGGLQVGTIGEAPAAIRADQIVVPNTGGVRLRYVNCPVAPFLDTSAQDVCSGI